MKYKLSAFRVALVQFENRCGDIRQNLKDIEKNIKTAVDNNSDFILFPECSLTGYSMDDIENISIEINDESVRELTGFAEKYSISFSVGLIERLNQKKYISQLMFSPETELHIHRKTHLGAIEKLKLSAGDEVSVFQLKDSNGNRVNIAFSICYETHFPELFSLYSLGGADIVLCPFCMIGNRDNTYFTLDESGEQRVKGWRKYMGSRCYDNTIYAAAVNKFEIFDNKFIGGGEAAWTFSSDLKSPALKIDNNISIYDFDIDLLRKNRVDDNRNFFLKNRRELLYRKMNTVETDNHLSNYELRR